MTSLLGIDLVISPAIIVGVLRLTVVLTFSVTLFSAVPAARERPPRHPERRIEIWLKITLSYAAPALPSR